MAEIELNVLTGQCLNRRIDNIEDVSKEEVCGHEKRVSRYKLVSSPE